jgi:hypothetical protein
MSDLKLAKPPDRTPIKLTIIVMPELHHSLTQYAAPYAEAYGREEPVTELIPAILVTFLEGDHAFARARAAGKSMIYRLLKDDKFPAPYKLSSAASRWSEREIVAWIDDVKDGFEGKKRRV